VKGPIKAPIKGPVMGTETRSRRASVGVLCLVLLGLTLGALGHVAVKAKHMEVALALGQESAITNELAAEKRRLAAELSKLIHPDRMKEAGEKLGMSYALNTGIRRAAPPSGTGEPAGAKR
jgi:hypothetical protein